MKFTLAALVAGLLATSGAGQRTEIDGPACQKLSESVYNATNGACDVKTGKFDCVMSESDNLQLVDLSLACTKEMTTSLKNQYEELGCDNLQRYVVKNKPLHDKLTKFCTSTKIKIKMGEELLHLEKPEPIKMKNGLNMKIRIFLVSFSLLIMSQIVIAPPMHFAIKDSKSEASPTLLFDYSVMNEEDFPLVDQITPDDYSKILAVLDEDAHLGYVSIITDSRASLLQGSLDTTFRFEDIDIYARSFRSFGSKTIHKAGHDVHGNPLTWQAYSHLVSDKVTDQDYPEILRDSAKDYIAIIFKKMTEEDKQNHPQEVERLMNIKRQIEAREVDDNMTQSSMQDVD